MDKRNSINWIIFSAIIIAIIIAIILFFLNPDATTPYSTIIIAIATVVYSYFSIRNYLELKRQNEFLIKKETENYILERKLTIKKLLIEINTNENISRRVLEQVEIDIKKIKNKKNKTILKYFKDNFKNSWYETYCNYFSEKEYQKFLDSSIDFKNDSLFFEIHRLYLLKRNTKKSIEHIFYCDESEIDLKFKRSIKYGLDNIVYKINKSIELIENIYRDSSKEINFDFKSFIENF